MALTITRDYSTGAALTEAQLDAICDSIETYINVTGLGADNIQDGAIGAAELGSSSVTESKIASSAVSTTKIADGAVTMAKLAAALQAYLVPSGAVSAWAGSSSAPTGWLLCDGSAVNRTTYAALFAAIGTAHGTGDGATTFNLPDYRGRFLRMVDGSASVDPDKASRTAMATGGNTGNNVGSVQTDAFQGHHHANRDPLQLTTIGQRNGGGNLAISGGATYINFTDVIGDPESDGTNGTPRTTSETRPSNAYCYYIVKT
jgi:hypothetical protein